MTQSPNKTGLNAGEMPDEIWTVCGKLKINDAAIVGLYCSTEPDDSFSTRYVRKDLESQSNLADAIIEVIADCNHYKTAPPWEITYKLSKALAEWQRKTEKDK